MKKAYFFIGGGLIISILVGFWLYSFLYGSPTNSASIFTNLGIFGQDNSVPFETPSPVDEGTPYVDTTTNQLRQLTTKPVVGMRILTTEETKLMRYVEAGTGHVFDIDLTTGEETRVSQISVPVASEAVISPSGDYVAIRSGYNNQNDLVLVDLTNDTNPSSTLLPNQVESFAFGYNNELLFTEFSLGQTEGKGYLPSTKSTRRLFTAPFTAHEMAWNNSSSSNHVIFTKPAATMIGYGYDITAGGLRRLPTSGYGLTISQSNGGRFVGQRSDNSYTTTLTTRTGEIITPVAVTIPDKCTAAALSDRIGYCASPAELQNGEFPDTWYKGELVLSDYIWRINKESVTLLADPLRDLGRSLDITQLSLSTDEEMLYFINKTDKTLWLYEI